MPNPISLEYAVIIIGETTIPDSSFQLHKDHQNTVSLSHNLQPHMLLSSPIKADLKVHLCAHWQTLPWGRCIRMIDGLIR